MQKIKIYGAFVWKIWYLQIVLVLVLGGGGSGGGVQKICQVLQSYFYFYFSTPARTRLPA